MSTIISIVFFIAIFLIFAMKREYVEILITLIIGLVLDFAIVKGLSAVPLIGSVAISVGIPFMQILIYALIKMIVMGIFYFLLQKNDIVAIIGYLFINLILNKVYMTMSGNIGIDMILNAIIVGVIFFVYKKSDYMDEVKWFAIIAIIIDLVLEILMDLIF